MGTFSPPKYTPNVNSTYTGHTSTINHSRCWKTPYNRIQAGKIHFHAQSLLHSTPIHTLYGYAFAFYGLFLQRRSLRPFYGVFRVSYNSTRTNFRGMILSIMRRHSSIFESVSVSPLPPTEERLLPGKYELKLARTILLCNVNVNFLFGCHNRLMTFVLENFREFDQRIVILV